MGPSHGFRIYVSRYKDGQMNVYSLSRSRLLEDIATVEECRDLWGALSGGFWEAFGETKQTALAWLDEMEAQR